MARRKLWIDARTWDEVKVALKNYGMSDFEVLSWISCRRTALRELSNRLNRYNGAAITDADYWCISGQDCLGEWSYNPTDGLQPIDYYELQEALDGPIELDIVCRSILKHRLVCDGHHPDLADSALDRLPWCYSSNGRPFAPTVEEVGWDKYARGLAKLIDKVRAERAQRKTIVQSTITPTAPQLADKEQAEYMSPVAIAREARAEGYDIDYRDLCKVRNLPDNGAKGKNRRKLRKSDAMEWIKKNRSRSLAQDHSPDASQVHEPLLDSIVRFLRDAGSAMTPAIAFEINREVKVAASILMNNPTIFKSSPDGWSLQ